MIDREKAELAERLRTVEERLEKLENAKPPRSGVVKFIIGFAIVTLLMLVSIGIVQFLVSGNSYS
ncbi:hypothetical protein ACFO9Q_20155 [Paenibacillus sp. GCM10023252]|uniref:hypothetical protein n=1 Tax=Paenibacillus sp. GCM10023252 TaxID=3252649 RepID=UPI00360E6628